MVTAAIPKLLRPLVRRAPVIAQAVGALAIAWGVGALAGLAWGAITFGAQALVAGTLAEAPVRPRKPTAPVRSEA